MQKEKGEKAAVRRIPSRRRREYILVINRSAGDDPIGNLRLARRLEKRLRRMGHDGRLWVASNWEDFDQQITTATRGRSYAVVVFGGDGSVRLAASRAVAAKSLLGIVPTGRYNNIYQSLYQHADPEKALDLIDSSCQRRIDAGLANGRFFLGNLVTGLVPGMVERLADKKLPRLALGWSKLASHAAEGMQRLATKIKIDSYIFEIEPYLLNIHLLSHLLTLPFAPAAVPDDGRVILLFDREGKRDTLAHYVRDLKKDRYQYTDGVMMVRGRRVTLSPASGRVWLMDGDTVEFPSNDLAIEILPQALRIFCHAPAKT